MTHQTYDPEFKSAFVRAIDRRLPVFTYLHKEYKQFPMPRNVNYFWSFGMMASLCLMVMIASGLVLAMQYAPKALLAFDSVERIMRDVNWGWMLRYIHMNGASMFFIVVYIHMYRSLYYGSYKEPRELVWIIGILIFVAMMATAFMGYVLPWGQMSFWGATVITNLFSAVPIIGEGIVEWLWGGLAVDDPTLNRFFVLHYLLPFVIVALVALHVVAVHVVGSNNPAGIEPRTQKDIVPFHPFVTAKDFLGVGVFLLVFAFFVFFAPNYMGHPDNYWPADSLVTPAHIVPEWYFLPFYAMLRAVDFQFFWIIPAKLGGVLVMFGSLVGLALLPWLDTSPVRSCRYRPIYRLLVWLFCVNFVLLAWCGGQPAEGIALILSKVGTAWFYLHLFILTPLIGKFENPNPLPDSIATSITGKGS